MIIGIMSSSQQKGNISRLLLTLGILALVAVLFLLAKTILNFGVRSGRYMNPNVASRVIEGTVYDRNGRPLSMPVPVLDDDGNAVSRTRTYPANFHACQLIDEIEKCFGSIIAPMPGYDEAVTYGKDVYLTIDIDMQYVLDLAVQDLYKKQNPSYVTAFIMDCKTGEILASSNYPYYDLNVEHSRGQNATYLSSIMIDGNLLLPSLVSRIVNYQGRVTDTSESINLKEAGLTTDLPSTIALLSRANNSNSSILNSMPASNPRYYVFIGSWNPQTGIENNSALKDAVAIVESGLKSQSKL